MDHKFTIEVILRHEELPKSEAKPQVNAVQLPNLSELLPQIVKALNEQQKKK